MNLATRMTVTAAMATAAASLGLLRLVSGGGWLAASAAAIAVVAIVGDLTRRSPLPRGAVIGLQTLALVLLDTALITPHQALLGFVPGPGAVHALVATLRQANEDIRSFAPPAHPTPGISAVLILAVTVIALLVDAASTTYGSAALSGLPLLAVYLVPATRLPGGMNWVFFGLAVLGYLNLLAAEGRQRLARWGRPLVRARGGGTSAEPVDTSSYGPTGRRIGITTLVAVLVVPLLIPSLPSGWFGLPSIGEATSGGTAYGGGTITISQQVDIKRDLASTSDIPLLRYTTTATDPGEQYLQLETLDDFDGERWQAAPETFNSLDGGRLPSAPGLSDPAVARSPVTTSVHVVGNVRLSLLPTPYPATRVAAAGHWSYAPNSLEVMGGTGAVRKGFAYRVTSLDVAPTARQLAAEGTVTGQEFHTVSEDLFLPSGFPAQVRQQALQITAGAATPFARAEKLQNWFLDNFQYSLGVAPNDGDNAILAFLKDRRGYCQQFAGTMAAMARALGIPARVAIGFTPGTQQSDGSYLVTTHDVHAWPELYFSGAGWVRFEPTPASGGAGQGSAPSWATPSAPGGPQAPATTAPGRTAPQPNNGCAPEGRLRSGCSTGTVSVRGAGSHGAAFGSLGPLGAVPRALRRWFVSGSPISLTIAWLVLAVLVVAAVPMAVRRRARVRRRRTLHVADRRGERAPSAEQIVGQRTRGVMAPIDLSGHRLQALAAWDELRDNATDLGYQWPASATPRQLHDNLITAASLRDDAREALGRVTRLAERAHYAPRLDDETASVFADVTTVRDGLAAPVDRWHRMRATVLPASALRRMRDNRRNLLGRFRGRMARWSRRLGR